MAMPIVAALNHLYRVVSPTTYEAIRTSPWIGTQFAPRDERTTTRPDWTYTGVYLYGRHTYVEFFDEGPQGPVGHTGLALALPAAEDTAAIAAAWRRALGGARTALVERPTPEGGVPWFHLACAEPDRRDGLHLWSMEYHAQFLERWHPTLTPARGIAPRDVLDRYAAVVGGAPRDAFLLEDIVSVELELSAAATAFLRAHLASVAAVTDHADGFVSALGGTRVRARTAPEPRGLLSVGCSLQRSVPAATHRFGSSTLSVDERAAIWSFV
jgi:hypothetical protein